MTLRALSSTILLLGVLPSLAAAQTAPKKYLAFGDSITEGRGDDPLRAQKGYPPRLQTLLQTAGVSATVVNFGQGGEKTPDALSRIDGVLAQGAPGDVLLLMEGTNDISKHIDLETTIFNLSQMGDRAEARNLGVIHATVIPRYPSAEVDANNLLTDELNGRTRNLAGLRGRGLADPNEVFRSTPGLFSGFYSTEKPDPVGHPNTAGYDILASVFFNVLRTIDNVPPVTGILVPLNGARNVRPDISIEVDFWDFGTGIDLANTFLSVNGQQVSVLPTGSTRHAHLSYQPLTPLSGTVTVGLRSRDLAIPANSVDREIARFRIRGANVLQGDLNEDGRVDGTDLVRLGLLFGAQRGDPSWDETADFNIDGRIDGLDLAVLASNFGRTNAA